MREAIRQMHQKDVKIRQICKLLGVSRNTVRRVLSADSEPKAKGSKYEEHLTLIKDLFDRCRGNVVRLQECLEQEHKLVIPYTSLTWIVRTFEIKEPKKDRCGQYVFGPGEEMQHDTSPFKILLGDTQKTVQCASLVLAYSRKIFIQFYPRFTRFEAKVFLQRAFDFMQGVCPRCVVDNTTLFVVSGTGPDAVISPEMEAFGRLYQVVFVPHKVNDPNRKARVERPFSYISKNFLAGRAFSDFHDLNAQAWSWCENVANAKVKKSLGMPPEQAYLMEKSQLIPLPAHVPEVYLLEYRVVDSEGYVQVQTNRYSVPEKLVGRKVEVYIFWDKIQIYYQHQKVAEHARILVNKQARVTDPTHHPPINRKSQGPCREECLLTGHNQSLDIYVQELKKRSRGRGVHKLRRLLILKRTYPEKAFIQAVQRAVQYRMYDLSRLEDIIISLIAGDHFDL
jgi:transposase